MVTSEFKEIKTADKTIELKAAPIVAVKAINGYTVFKKNGVNRVAVQPFASGRWCLIRAEQPSLTVYEPGEVLSSVLDCLGCGGDSAIRIEVSRVLWKDWD